MDRMNGTIILFKYHKIATSKNPFNKNYLILKKACRPILTLSRTFIHLLTLKLSSLVTVKAGKCMQNYGSLQKLHSTSSHQESQSENSNDLSFIRFTGLKITNRPLSSPD